MKHHFFWNGPFSNWHPSTFTYKNTTFNCAEQAMMYEKAMFFDDTETAHKILQTDSPKEQKALGRIVKNFDAQRWDGVKYELVRDILLCKFQLPTLKAELSKYSDCIFVEASPYDRIWGIGYSERDALDNIENWGENLLGKILTEISQTLKFRQ